MIELHIKTGDKGFTKLSCSGTTLDVLNVFADAAEAIASALMDGCREATLSKEETVRLMEATLYATMKRKFKEETK